jgi:salicylate hydroxylase
MAERNEAFISYPVSQGRLLNLAIFHMDYAREGTIVPDPWVSEAEDTEVISLFKDWAPEAKHLISVGLLSVLPVHDLNALCI